MEELPSIRNLLLMFFKHKFKICFVFLLTVVIITVVAFRITPIYRATASLIFQYGREYVYRPEVGDRGSLTYLNRDQAERLNSEIQILTSHGLMQKVLATLGVGTMYPDLIAAPSADKRGLQAALHRFDSHLSKVLAALGMGNPYPAPSTESQQDKALLQAALQRFETNLFVERIKKSDVIHVSFQHPNARITAEVVNLLVEFFKQKYQTIFDAPKTVRFLEAKVANYREELKGSEEKLKNFKKKYQISSLEEQRGLLLSQRTDLDSELLTLQRKEQELLEKYKGTHPLVINVRNEIQVIKQQGYRLRGKLQNLTLREKLLRNLQHELATNERNYNLYVNKLEEAHISGEVERQKTNNIRLIEPATVPLKPFNKTKRSVMMAIGMMIGTIGGFGVALIAEFSAQGLSTPNTAESLLGVPVLATIPYSKTLSRPGPFRVGREGMGIFETYRIKKSIAALLSSRATSSPKGERAVARLRRVGPAAISELIDALDTDRNRDSIVTLLVRVLNNETLPRFVTALSVSSPSRVVAGMVDVLGRGTRYDPNRLIGLLTHPNIKSSHLVKILLSHKHRLHSDTLRRLLDMLGQDDYTAILPLVEQVATEDSVAELIACLRSKDWTVRFYMARTLCRFRNKAAQDALVTLLEDPQDQVRLVALKGLAAMQVPVDTRGLCRLLRDPDETVQDTAMALLLARLRGESAEVRQQTVEGLVAVGDVRLIKGILETFRDKDWWITVRVARAFGMKGGAKMVEAVLVLFKDHDTFIRQCAFEILYTMKDEQTFKCLVEALKDRELREVAVDALTALHDKRAIPMLLSMLEGDMEVCLIAIRALVVLGEPQTVHPLLVQLQNPHTTVQQEVLRALAVLTNEAYAPDVLQAVMSVRRSAEGEVKQLANRMATMIIQRFGQKVLPGRGFGGATGAMREFLEEETTADALVQPVQVTPSQVHPAQTAPMGGRAAELMVEAVIPEPGMVLADRYRIIRRVGQGACSTVFLADDTMVREEVILKILNPQVTRDDDVVKRFIHELRYARKVTHRNVIRIYNFMNLGDSYAISMEYFPSHSLADELKEGRPLGLKRGLKTIWSLCCGISAAHQVNVVHRDLKPRNILINDNRVVKIVDFGVAAVTRDMGTRLTKVGTLLGTPTYMAPEQIRSRTIDARTDIYSLGVIMYEVFTGRPPYAGDDMSVLFQHVEGNPVLPRQVNPEIEPILETIILEAMAVHPDQRFQSIDALRKKLVAFARLQR